MEARPRRMKGTLPLDQTRVEVEARRPREQRMLHPGRLEAGVRRAMVEARWQIPRVAPRPLWSSMRISKTGMLHIALPPEESGTWHISYLHRRRLRDLFREVSQRRDVTGSRRRHHDIVDLGRNALVHCELEHESTE